MSCDTIQKLYLNFAVLADAEDKIGEHEKEYKEILEAVKGSAKEKRLAGQFIPRFFKSFPKLAVQALDAQFDLCEDDDVSIRKQAIKDLPIFCKEKKELTYKVADALTQLLQAEDPAELSIVCNSLTSLFKIDSKGAVSGMFNQIKIGDDGIREKGLKFFRNRLRLLMQEIVKCEKAQDLLVELLKQTFQDATHEEMSLIIEMMSQTKVGKSGQGIINFLAEQVEAEKPVTITDEEAMERVVVYIKLAMPYFSKGLSSARYLQFICEELIPQLKTMPGFEEGAEQVLVILKTLAECATHIRGIESGDIYIKPIYSLLTELMPPADTAEELGLQEPRLQFSYVECLLYSLHKLCKLSPELFEDAATLKSFRMRLQYFARATQGYISTLNEALKGKTEEELKSQENRIKIVALKTTSNINTLIKDFFHTPPVYKASIVLSWNSSLEIHVNTKSSEDSKRKHNPITFDPLPSKKGKVEKGSQLEIYQPPSGKYSSNIKPPTEQQQRIRNVRSRPMLKNNYRLFGKPWVQRF